VAAGETGSVRPALQPVERVDQVGQRAARVGAGVASQLAGRGVGGVWMAGDPMVFGKPAHERAWATRAVLGEEQWIEDRPMDAAMAVNVGASVAGVAAMIAARKRRAAPAAVSMATLMALLLWYWELMARYHDERGDR
jgi:hypothetical protein